LEESASVYVRASTLWPTWPAPVYGLAALRLDEGRSKDAIILLDQAERLGPWRRDHHLQLADKLFAKGNYTARGGRWRLPRSSAVARPVTSC